MSQLRKEVEDCFKTLRSLSKDEQVFLALNIWGCMDGGGGGLAEFIGTLTAFDGMSEEDFWMMRLDFPFRGGVKMNYAEFKQFLNGQWRGEFLSLQSMEQEAMIGVFAIVVLSEENNEDSKQAISVAFEDLDPYTAEGQLIEGLKQLV